MKESVMTEVKAKKQLAHLLDATKCIGCTACIVACSETNYPEMANREIPGRGWLASNIRPVTLETRARPVQILVQCQHCENAPCITTCPFGANYRDPETGLVKTDERMCVGCNYCIASCPYDVRWSHPDSGLPMKCMGAECEKRLANGENPACVAACPVGARLFGDVLDPNSPISQYIATSRTQKLLEHKGTKPNFFVVVQK